MVLQDPFQMLRQQRVAAVIMQWPLRMVWRLIPLMEIMWLRLRLGDARRGTRDHRLASPSARPRQNGSRSRFRPSMEDPPSMSVWLRHWPWPSGSMRIWRMPFSNTPMPSRLGHLFSLSRQGWSWLDGRSPNASHAMWTSSRSTFSPLTRPWRRSLEHKWTAVR